MSDSGPIASVDVGDGGKLKGPKQQKQAAPPTTPLASPKSKLDGRAMVTALTLPSKGYPYDGKLPEGQILISSMTISEEKIFMGKGNSAADKTNILIQRACDIGEMSPDDLLASDRFYLLLKIRSLSYGNTYGFQFRCDDCSTQFRQEVNLETDLQTKVLNEEWEEPFPVDLPQTGALLKCRLLRGKDERQIARMVQRKHQKNIHEPGNPSYTLLLSRHIVSIDGEDTNEAAALSFVERLPVMDRRTLTDEVEQKSPGFDPSLEIECPSCGFLNEAVLPTSTEFFQPRRS